MAELIEKKKKKPYSSITYTTGDPDYNIKMFNKLAGSGSKGYLNGTIEPDPSKVIDAATPDGSSSVTDSGSTGEATAAGDSAGMGESLELSEAKRYVRRYYIKPINKFASNKTEILQKLIEYEDQDLIIYTLNNLGDEKDVSKLTSHDIIYYYEDGILYDKNRLRLMDYDLYIKNEEQRPEINLDTVSDAKFADVYSDRLTESTESADETAVSEISSEESLPKSQTASRKFILYCHTNNINGKKYFGITTQKDYSRWRHGEGYKNQPVFYRAIQKYGWDNFSHDIIARDLTETEARELEKQYIKDFHTFVNDEQSLGYNTSIGGESNLKYATDDARRAAMQVSRHKTYLKDRERRLAIAKKAYTDNHEFYLNKNHAQYYKHREARLLKDHEYQKSLKQQLDLIRQLNMAFPGRLNQEDCTKIINFRNCRNKPYLDELLSNFSEEEIQQASAINTIATNEAFNLDFVDFNAYGEELCEGKEINGVCCICGEPIEGYGNNAEPYKAGRCCNGCNIKFVIPARMEQAAANREEGND